MPRLWITLGWRWFIRLFVILIVIPSVLVQWIWSVPTWDYLWTHYFWKPYVPFMLVLFVMFASTFVPFGNKRKGGEYPNE